jgi:hypothetical protein
MKNSVQVANNIPGSSRHDQTGNRVRIAQSVKRVDYGLSDGGTWGSIRRRGKNYSLLHRCQAGSGAHPASCPMSDGGKVAVT